jgi:anaerobic selenocysteine-containing dehydrogenase
MIAAELASGFHPTLTIEMLFGQPNGIDLGPLRPSLPGRLLTSNKRINAAPAVILDDLERLAAETFDPDSLVLIGRRSVRSNNSWMHNSPRLMAKRPDDYLLVHQDDLDRLELKNGEMAVVSTHIGQVSVRVQASDEIMPGVVCLPHGWGHRIDGMRLNVASALPGENFNMLVDERMLDVPSAGSVVQGIAVRVRRDEAQ